MKISFLIRVDCFDKYGGDTYQIEQYKKYLELYGDTVTISNDLNFPRDSDFYILVNLDRPIELLIYYEKLKRYGLENKAILLPIHHSLKSIKQFESNSRTGVLGFLSWLIKDYNKREKIKNIHRGIYYPALRKYSFLHLSNDYEKNIKKILDSINSCIVLSHAEVQHIRNDYGVDISAKSVLIRNGVELSPELPHEEPDKSIDILICGRIEERKNSLGILLELQKTNLSVVFVGGENKNNKRYLNDFKNVLSNANNIRYLGKKSHEELVSLYLKSKFHLSASWFEVASLVDLEAFAYGCKVISSTEGSTNEYLKDQAIYISPKNIGQLIPLLEKVNSDTNIKEQNDFIRRNFTWEIASRKLYDFLLEKKNVK